MTAVTVTDRKEITGDMCFEILKGTFSDGYTYTSKFGTIVVALANSNSRVGTWTSISGSVITIHCASASGDTFWMLIVGK